MQKVDESKSLNPAWKKEVNTGHEKLSEAFKKINGDLQQLAAKRVLGMVEDVAKALAAQKERLTKVK